MSAKTKLPASAPARRRISFTLSAPDARNVKLAGDLGGVGLVTYGRDGISTGHEEAILTVLVDMAARGLAALPVRREAGFASYSAANMTGRFAALFDRVLAGVGRN